MSIWIPAARFSLKLAGLGLLCALASCSSKESEPPTGVIPEAQLKALEAAKQVEGVIKEHDEALRKKLDEAK